MDWTSEAITSQWSIITLPTYTQNFLEVLQIIYYSRSYYNYSNLHRDVCPSQLFDKCLLGDSVYLLFRENAAI